MSAARIARTLGGTPTGGGFVCRCPVASHGSGRGDRRPSLSVKDGVCGVLVYCHSGCSARDVLDELRRRGLLDGPLTMNQRVRGARDSEIRDFRKPSTAPGKDRGRDDRARTCRALAIWAESTTILRGTLVWSYLASRMIDCDALPAGIDRALRFHAACPFGRGRFPCMVALFTDAVSREPRAIHRTALTAAGEKIARMTYGPIKGCVLRLWPDECVTLGLLLGEGIETVLVAATHIKCRGTLLQPAWAAGNANNLQEFPVLSGIEALTILVDHDKNGRGQRAAAECAGRWTAAGREVTQLIPRIPGGDFADLVGVPS